MNFVLPGGGGASDLQLIMGEPTPLIGTSVPFTAPANAVFGIITPVGLSTNGTSVPLIQLGDVDGYEATGYLNEAGFIQGNPPALAYGMTAFTNGIALTSATASTVTMHGSIYLTRANNSTNTWVATGMLNNSAGNSVYLICGSKALSATLTGGRFITVNNTDQYDAGYFTTMWWVKP